MLLLAENHPREPRPMWSLLKNRGNMRILSLLTLSLLAASCGGRDDAVTTTVPVQETAATAAATTTHSRSRRGGSHFGNDRGAG